MMKKILVPIDFSKYSLNALKVAAYIAKVKEMDIRLVHIVEDSYTPYANMTGRGLIETNAWLTYRNEIKDATKQQLEEIAEGVRKKNIQVEFEVILDMAKRAIVKDAEDNDVDLIVMGSHGHNDLEDIFIGGTSEKVIRTSAIPVLTVHESSENYKIDKIVFASDFEEAAIESILEKVIHFAEIFMAELFLVRVNTPSKLFSGPGSRERVDELAKKFKLHAGAVTSYSDRSEEEGIVNYAKEVGADLIALGTHGRTGLARLFKGSIAEDVVGYSPIPVLTYNISREKISRSIQPVTKERKLKSDPIKKKNL